MFKRMSVLVRREGDTRAQFSRRWLRHGQFIAALPGLRSYVQNHVKKDFALSGRPFLRADGFVELRFDSADAMAQAFSSPAASAMAMDEPGFLGHGSGYVLRADTGLTEANEGNKLILALGDGETSLLAASIAAVPLTTLIRDDVVALIPKLGMAPPQPVSSFWHVHCPDATIACDVARRIADVAQAVQFDAAVFQVKTVQIV